MDLLNMDLYTLGYSVILPSLAVMLALALMGIALCCWFEKRAGRK
jgi:hypothetical protein